MIAHLYLLASTIDINSSDFEVPKGQLNQASVDKILQIVFGIFGAIAVIVVILGALKYVMSQGNAAETAKAKNAIIYALVGLMISILAYAIVMFVVRAVR